MTNSWKFYLSVFVSVINRHKMRNQEVIVSNETKNVNIHPLSPIQIYSNGLHFHITTLMLGVLFVLKSLKTKSVMIFFLFIFCMITNCNLIFKKM